MVKLANISEWKPRCVKVEEPSSADVALRWLQEGKKAFDGDQPQTSEQQQYLGAAVVRNVLIVDDSPVIRRALCQLFQQQADFNVCGEAENGREAVEKALQLKPDLIVTDLTMPTMNGLKETRQLRQLMPDLPIIIYTVYSVPSGDKELLSAGASAVISKSASSATLMSTARRCSYRKAA